MARSDDIQKKLKKKRTKELFAYFREISKKDGFFAAIRRTLKYLKRRTKKRGRFLPSTSTLLEQTQTDVTGWPKISILVAAYNPPRQFFADLLDSVAKQSYPNWELCILNASEDPTVVKELVALRDDPRIKVKEAPNEGIAENQNRAAQLATGEYYAFADHDDMLGPNAMFEIARAISRTEAGFLYSDEALFETTPAAAHTGHFKPMYSPQYLMNVNYIGHLVAVKKEIFHRLGGLRKEFDGAQDYDFNLRAINEAGGAEHIRKVLYFWRQHPGSTSTGVEAKPYVEEASKKLLAQQLEREDRRGYVVNGMFPSTYKIDYSIKGRPLISIIIPSCEHIPDLDRCIRSIFEKTAYKQFEVLVVENNSKMPETFAYYQTLIEKYPDVRVLVYEEPGFNFSRICNFGRQSARGEYLLFLNNDTEVITPGWLGEMVQLCQFPEIGVVGAMLYYPDDTVQHAGVITGLGGYAGHSHKYAQRGHSGYMFRQACVQELSAVTAACMMVRRDIFDLVAGFDAGFSVAYNDVDLCMRVRRRGYGVVFTPYAELYHYESKSRGSDEEGPAAERFAKEQDKLLQRYGDELLDDLYYSPWLTKDREDFSESDVLPQA